MPPNMPPISINALKTLQKLDRSLADITGTPSYIQTEQRTIATTNMDWNLIGATCRRWIPIAIGNTELYHKCTSCDEFCKESEGIAKTIFSQSLFYFRFFMKKHAKIKSRNEASRVLKGLDSETALQNLKCVLNLETAFQLFWCVQKIRTGDPKMHTDFLIRRLEKQHAIDRAFKDLKNKTELATRLHELGIAEFISFVEWPNYSRMETSIFMRCICNQTDHQDEEHHQAGLFFALCFQIEWDLIQTQTDIQSADNALCQMVDIFNARPTIQSQINHPTQHEYQNTLQSVFLLKLAAGTEGLLSDTFSLPIPDSMKTAIFGIAFIPAQCIAAGFFISATVLAVTGLDALMMYGWRKSKIEKYIPFYKQFQDRLDAYVDA